jgi:Fe-S cluster biogenesis protein NfuA
MEDSTTLDFSDIKFTHISPLARKLFGVNGINRVFYGSNFITITKLEEEEWTLLKPEIYSLITDHYTKGEPLFTDEPPASDTLIHDDDSEAVAMIKEIIDSRIRPFVQEDGGDVAFIEFDEETGQVYLLMKGSCAGCPSSGATLKNGIENMLKHYVAEVNEVIGRDELIE